MGGGFRSSSGSIYTTTVAVVSRVLEVEVAVVVAFKR